MPDLADIKPTLPKQNIKQEPATPKYHVPFGGMHQTMMNFARPSEGLDPV